MQVKTEPVWEDELLTSIIGQVCPQCNRLWEKSIKECPDCEE